MPGMSRSEWQQWQNMKAQKQAEIESRLDEKRKGLANEPEAKDSKGQGAKGGKSDKDKVAQKESEKAERLNELLNGVSYFAGV
jgi:hypothetical protein